MLLGSSAGLTTVTFPGVSGTPPPDESDAGSPTRNSAACSGETYARATTEDKSITVRIGEPLDGVSPA